MARIAFPFLTIPESAVAFGGWLIGDPGAELRPAPDLLENWDYERDLEVAARMDVDFSEVASALCLPTDQLSLAAVLSIGTGTGSKPRRIDHWVEKVLDASRPDVELAVGIPGRSLSGRLRLEAQLLLQSPIEANVALAPKSRGARLWRTHHDVLLEDGGSSRFPVEMTSFAEHFRGRREEMAPWFLHWSKESLHADFAGSVRLYINSDYEDLAARFQEGDRCTIQAILGDVMIQMISAVLRTDHADTELSACEEGSVGHQVKSWMDIGFPGESSASVLSLQNRTPNRFHAALIAAADPGVED